MSEKSRQNSSYNDSGELATREDDFDNLADGLLGRYEEYLNEPENRLNFVASMSGEDFLNLATHINARLRGERPIELKKDEVEKNGAFLPLLHTPSSENKRAAFYRGFDAVKEYISTSTDDTQEKLKKVGVASEGLVILVHPFGDGNGRTSRFIGSFLENGTTNRELLKAETVSGAERKTTFTRVSLATKESLLATAENDDIILDDGEYDELLRRAEVAPDDVEGMYLTIKRLIENERVQQDVFRYRTDVKAA